MIYFGILFNVFLLYALFRYLERTGNIKRALFYYVFSHLVFSLLFNIFDLSLLLLQALIIWLVIDLISGFIILWLINRFAGRIFIPIFLIVFGLFFRFGVGAYLALS